MNTMVPDTVFAHKGSSVQTSYRETLHQYLHVIDIVESMMTAFIRCPRYLRIKHKFLCICILGKMLWFRTSYVLSIISNQYQEKCPTKRKEKQTIKIVMQTCRPYEVLMFFCNLVLCNTVLDPKPGKYSHQ